MEMHKSSAWHREYRPVTYLNLVVLTQKGKTIADTALYVHRRKDSYECTAHTGSDITSRIPELEAAARRGLLFTKVETDSGQETPRTLPLNQPYNQRQELLKQATAFFPINEIAESAVDALMGERAYIEFHRERQAARRK